MFKLLACSSSSASHQLLNTKKVVSCVSTTATRQYNKANKLTKNAFVLSNSHDKNCTCGCTLRFYSTSNNNSNAPAAKPKTIIIQKAPSAPTAATPPPKIIVTKPTAPPNTPSAATPPKPVVKPVVITPASSTVFRPAAATSILSSASPIVKPSMPSASTIRSVPPRHSSSLVPASKVVSIPARGPSASVTASKGTSTFVSSYYQVNENDVLDFLNRHGLAHKAQGVEVVVKECPFCHDIKGNISNMYKLYINRLKGAYNCHRCGSKGTWYDFKIKLDVGENPVLKMSSSFGEVKKKPSREEAEGYQTAYSSARYHEVEKYMEKRGINKEIAQKFGIGCGYFNFIGDAANEAQSQLCITFPMYRPRPQHQDKNASSTAPPAPIQYDIVRHKMRSISDKRNMKLDPVGGAWGLFGLHLVPDDAKEVVLTEGEYDAMAVYQATGKPAVSLPNGCRSLPVEVLPLLERFEKIYLWMDDDAPGQQGAQSFAQKLGIGRTVIVHCTYDDMPIPEGDENQPKPKDANDALKMGFDLAKLLEKAEPLEHSRIVKYDKLKTDIFREFYDQSSDVTGVQSIYFPKMNSMIKGLRRGELTIFTGPTGVGKTTILSQLSLDYCIQGVSTLWGSFEIKNHRLISKMLCQLAGRDLRNHRELFEQYSQKFQQLPMYFLNFYGSTSIDHVLDAMDYAVYVHDVQHIIIDNLQFMTSGQGMGIEKFDIQDRAIEKFRAFATHKNVHVSMVIHPRKVEDGQLLGLASVFGSAKATQEADNVLIIQKGKKYRFFSVKKNRFDGSLGDIPYRFDKESNRIYELTDEQIEEVEQGLLELSY